jgi:hypothetical protein
MAKYIANIGGSLAEIAGTSTSAGAVDADKIVQLDSSGRLSATVMPTGIGADTSSINASEALAAGDFVNIWNNAGTASVRKADATVAGKEAHGFVLASAASGSPALIYFEGTNGQVSGQVPGPVWLSTTAGAAASSTPTGSGNISQIVGFATSASSINFQYSRSITLV